MNYYCKVSGCRFHLSHSTKSHKCGICNQFGHGQLECNSHIKKTALEKYYNQILPEHLWCDIEGCKSKKNHKRSAHHCNYCFGRGHSILNCPNNLNKKDKIKIKCPICNKINNLIDNKFKIFGLSEKCKVCHDNEINIYLPDCGHACLCEECMLIIGEDSN